MDLAAFAVPGLGVVLIGWVASMMQGERAELTRRRLEAEVGREAPVDHDTADGADACGPTPDLAYERPDEREDERTSERNPTARVAARAEVRRLLKRHGNALTAKRVQERTGVSISRARTLLREERGLRLVGAAGRAAERPAAEVER
jgi:hypothetical protein